MVITLVRSNGMPSGRVGSVPTATSTWAADTVSFDPSGSVTSTAPATWSAWPTRPWPEDPALSRNAPSAGPVLTPGSAHPVLDPVTQQFVDEVSLVRVLTRHLVDILELRQRGVEILRLHRRA